MPATTVDSAQIRDGTVQRSDLNVATVGQAVVAKLLQGANVSLSSTGADAGTGDVTISVPGGGTGPPGVNAYTTTTSSFIVPASGSTTTVTVAGASWLVVGQIVYIDTAGGGAGLAGALIVQSIAGNTLTLRTP